MTKSFWKDAAAALPRSVRLRYAAEFEAAERFECLFDLWVETWRGGKHMFAWNCKWAARRLRTVATHLDSAARRNFDPRAEPIPRYLLSKSGPSTRRGLPYRR
jgi:hypothetical protein